MAAMYNIPCTGHLLETARRNLVDSKPANIPPTHRVVNLFQTGLEAFQPEQGRYDCLWIQWAIMYLTDGTSIRAHF